MKHTIIKDRFIVIASWNAERRILRIESGPVEVPDEMIYQMEGLTEWGARSELARHLSDMIGIDSDQIKAFQAALHLPELPETIAATPSPADKAKAIFRDMEAAEFYSFLLALANQAAESAVAIRDLTDDPAMADVADNLYSAAKAWQERQGD